MSAEQIPLDLSPRPALGRDAFVVTRSNAEALARLEAASWPGGRLALVGPAASGKTHLAHVWAAETGAAVIPARDIARHDLRALAAPGRVAVEDVPGIAGQRDAEVQLFHLHDRLGAEGGALLLTGREAPARWAVALPDLASRLAALGVAELRPPDDALLGALLEKQFADRHLEPKDAVLRFLVTRMTRSAEAARELAAEIDRLSLARQRPVSIALASLALERLAAPPQGSLEAPQGDRP